MTGETTLRRVRELLDLTSADLTTSNGYLDLLGDEPPARRTLALAAMRSRALPVIYERWWRPAIRLVGPNPAAELKLAHELLNVRSGQLMLDVACGPGNFTRSFASDVGPTGLVIGFDESATMLGKAVQQTSAEQVGYVRGDARTLPFPDHTFDAVGCFLAMHLIPEPFRALDELIRVLAPGGRIAVFVPYLPGGRLPKLLDRAVNAPLGLRAFGRTEFTDAFTKAGLTDIRQQVTGLFQFVSARKG